MTRFWAQRNGPFRFGSRFAPLGTWALPVLAACLPGFGCGTDVVYRPVAVDLLGVTPDAAAIEVRWLTDESPDCSGVTVDSVASFPAESRARWTADRMDRRLELPRSGSGEGTLVAFTEDEDGRVLQVACARVAYADVESPEVILRMSPVR